MTDLSRTFVAKGDDPIAIRQALLKIRQATKDLGTMASQNSDAVDITGGTIVGTDITVGAGKTLDVSAGTLTLLDNQIDVDKIGTTDTDTTKVLQPDGLGGIVVNAMPVPDHNDLGSIDGGTTDEYYHLTSAQHTIATQAASATVAGYVDTSAQTIAGVKTFSSSPIGPTPTTDMQLSTKKYVDDNAGSGGSTPVGSIQQYIGATEPSGWLLLQGGAIGDASSGAATRANADTETLYTLLWNSMADAQAPVSSGRGATAAADFAAHKTITLPDMRGRAVIGSGTGSGLTARTHGTKGGAETHTLATTEIPEHNHAITVQGANTSGSTGGYFAPGSGSLTWSGGATAANTGGGEAHANMQPWIAINYIIKY